MKKDEAILYKVRNRNGGIILSTLSIKNVTNFLNISTWQAEKAIRLKTAIQHQYTIEAIPIKNTVDRLELATAQMVDNGYTSYGKFIADKERGKI